MPSLAAWHYVMIIYYGVSDTCLLLAAQQSTPLIPTQAPAL